MFCKETPRWHGCLDAAIAAAVAVPLFLTPPATADITRVLDAAGDGFGGLPFHRPRGIAVAPDGTFYVAGNATDNLFRVQPNGVIAQVVAPTGDGMNPLDAPFGVACDLFFVWVSGTNSDNVFRDRGSSLQLIDSTGDGMGNGLDAPYDVAIARDGSRTSYVAGGNSDNAFSMSLDGSVVELLIDSTGDGVNGLDLAYGIDVDAAGNVYVTGASSNNAFKITPAGAITQIIDSTGDGTNPLTRPFGIAVSDAGVAYVTGAESDNAFRIDLDGSITQIIDASGDGDATLDRPTGVGVDSAGNAYVAGSSSDNVWRIQPDGGTCVIIDVTGDGTSEFRGAEGIAIRVPTRDVFVTGMHSHNVYRIDAPDPCPLPCPADLDGSGAVDFGDILAILAAWGNAGGPEDLDGSGTVDFGDLLVVMGSWGPCR